MLNSEYVTAPVQLEYSKKATTGPGGQVSRVQPSEGFSKQTTTRQANPRILIDLVDMFADVFSI
jgi:hypothetical protein